MYVVGLYKLYLVQTRMGLCKLTQNVMYETLLTNTLLVHENPTKFILYTEYMEYTQVLKFALVQYTSHHDVSS